MKKILNNDNVELLKKFRDSFKKNEKLETNKKTSCENTLKQTLLDLYKLDAFEILIKRGFKINAAEYKKLQKEYIKAKRKKLNITEIKLIKEKYDHTLIYLIEIGCLKYLKSFKQDFIYNLVTNFENISTFTKQTEIVYSVEDGIEVGNVTPSGRIIMKRPYDGQLAIGKDDLIRKQQMNISRYKKPLALNFFK